MSQAVLLINLGSPDSPTVADLRRYLRDFLMDKYVIDLPYPLRWLIVHLFILPFRPKRSAEAYAKIWQRAGSPLITNTQAFAASVQQFSKHKIFWAMRYGNPSIKQVMREIKASGYDDVLVAPLYPHHALSATVTAMNAACKSATELGLEVRALPAFYANVAHQTALAKSIRHAAATHDYILFSYHGLPVRHITKADSTGRFCMQVENCCTLAAANSPDAKIAHATCYRHQVITTTNAVAKRAHLKSANFGFAFQSRVGRDAWLKPMTPETLIDLAKKGIRKLAVIAPAFVVDNLETLEEIDIRYRKTFLDAGGEKFTYIPCLNDDAVWAKGFAALIDKSAHAKAKA
ncbi:MAG: ferrochelatase [Spirochaetes bacterium]|nr:ferrochelatase [Spirochaetota bacterium]